MITVDFTQNQDYTLKVTETKDKVNKLRTLLQIAYMYINYLAYMFRGLK
jgi:hypothetical protein